MLFLICFPFASSSPIYRITGTTLTISGNGNITQKEVKEQGAYDSFESVVVKDNISAIKINSFQGFKSLKSVYFKSSFLRVIESGAFRSCPLLSSVNFLPGVETLGQYALAECPSIANISLPDSLTVLSDGVFSKDIGLVSVKLSKNIISFGYQEFSECTHLKELILDDKLEIISNMIISGTLIERLDFPASFRESGTESFDGALNLKFIGIHPDNPHFSNDEQGILYNKDKTAIVKVPSMIDSLVIPSTVTEICRHGIFECKKLISIDLSNNINKLYDQSVYTLSNLVSITIGSGLVSVPSGSFGNLVSLTHITFRSGVEQICERGFEKVPKLKSLDFSSTVSCIEHNAFPAGLSIESITIEEGNKALEIEDGVLYQKANGIRTSIPLVMYNATSVTIGKYITEVSININNLTHITVEEGNTEYSSHKGILYNSNRTVVLLIPRRIISIKLHPNTKNISASSGQNCQAADITINEGLEYIESFGLGYSSIKSIILPQSLKLISSYSFFSCKELQSVILHCSELEIMSFMDCSSLSIVEFTKECNISRFPYAIFFQTGLNSITIPKELKSIESQCFDSSALSSIIIPKDSKLKTIHSRAFANTNLASIAFPEGIGLTTISDLAFKNTKLETISFPDSLKDICSESFEITTLKSISFSKNSNIRKILSKAFFGTSIKSLYLPSSIEVIGESSFANCLDLNDVKIESNNHLESLGSYAFSGCVKLKTVILGKGSLLKELNPAIFSQCRSLQHFQLPNSIEEIHSQAFFQCERLIEIEINKESNLTEFGEMSFDGCHSLSNIFVPRKVTAIRNRSFNECDNLTSLIFDSNISNFIIETNAFYGCYHLPSVSFPKGLKELGPKSFETCRDLSDIKFAPGCYLDRIQENTFFGCIHLSTLILPAAVTILEKGSFNGCSELKTVIFESNNVLKEICDSVFSGCELLEVIDFGGNSTLDKIGISAFKGCNSLTEVYLTSSIEYIASRAFESCAKLSKITFGKGSRLKSIQEYTFKGCKRLQQIYIPPNVSSVGISSFEDCINLQTVLFEGSKVISKDAFKNCEKLYSLHLSATIEEIEPDSFFGCVSLQNISIAENNELKPHFRISNDKRSIISADKKILITCPSASGTYLLEESITEIAACAFRQTNILEVNLSKVIKIGDKAFEGTPLKRTSIRNLRYVGERAFASCPNLIIDPMSVTKFVSVEVEAFYGSPMTFSKIVFDENLESIGRGAFTGVNWLKEIEYCGNKRFENCPDDVFEEEMRKVIVSESYDGEAFCGVGVKRVEGNPCIAATIGQYNNMYYLNVGGLLFDFVDEYNE